MHCSREDDKLKVDVVMTILKPIKKHKLFIA